MKLIRNRVLQLLVDGAVVVVAVVLAYAIRFEAAPPRIYLKQAALWLPYIVLVRAAIFTLGGVYRLVWRYIGLRDLPRIFLPVLAGSLVVLGARYALVPLLGAAGIPMNPVMAAVPLGVIAVEAMLTAGGMLAARILWRLLKEREAARLPVRAAGEPAALPRRKARALLVGAGLGGATVARELAVAQRDLGFEAVGFLDDDSAKRGMIIHGYRVLGPIDRLPELAATTGADRAVITMSSAPPDVVRRIVHLAEEARLRVQIVPGVLEIVTGRVSVSKARDVAIEDLLGREPVRLDEEVISGFVAGKRVMVTGAGGSIGSEICRQLHRFGPAELVLLDQAENPLFHIHRELARRWPEGKTVPVVADVVDRQRVAQIIAAHRPEVVFHAAAHKHVPLMEANPGEAVRNNAAGSRNVADLAHAHGVEAFVMISTDKAVNPTSVMGATKRLAEMYVQALAARSQTRFITVRFGNVLDSEGSVVPVFREQIARGGPVTVTHRDMVRYFMTIPEASQLVLQAGAMGQGGEIFILEMGEEIRILNLARDLIRLSGYRPDVDIPIVFTGMRPGEKLYEEMNLDEENAAKTRHPRIWIGRSRVSDLERVDRAVSRLVALAGESPDLVRAAMAEVVPEYRPGGAGAPTARPRPPQPAPGVPVVAEPSGHAVTSG